MYSSDLAQSLDNLSNRLSGVGRKEEALAPILEAVEIRRASSAEANPIEFDQFFARFPRTLRLSFHLDNAGKPEDAAATMEDAVVQYRRLYDQRLTVFRGDLADALIVFRDYLQAVGKTEEALSVGEEACQIRA